MAPPTPAPQELADLYDPKTVVLPASFGDSLADKPRVYQRMRQMLWNQLGEEEVREGIAHYWALCSMQDLFFGELLQALDATGQKDDTMVVFAGDHGDFCYAHGLCSLGIPSFREVYNVPAVIRWPAGIENPGRAVDEFVSLADFAPTFLDLAGREPEDRLTGRSLSPFLFDEPAADWPDHWCSQSNGNEVYFTQRIVQTKEHKYVANWFDFDEMYDLASDPHEMHNLAFPGPDRLVAGRAAPVSSAGACSPWPHLSPELEATRRDLLKRMWRFAYREEDTIFNAFAPVALAAYGPMIAFDKA
jgi:arylsulfatase A-like enzyme